MRESVKSTFLTLVTVFLIYIFFNQAHRLDFLYIHYVIQLIIYVLVMVGIIWIVRKLNTWMASFYLRFPVEVMMSILLILFFTHEFFTPYFYTESYLKQAGLEKIEIYQQLSDKDLSIEERAELAEEAVVEGLAYAYAATGIYPTLGPLEQVEIKEVTRRYHQFKLTVYGEQQDQDLADTYIFTFQKDGLGFKINGLSTQ
ncbi:hypothetical protein [Virgibacillus kimchii]